MAESVTVVIPTRERADVLWHSLRTVVNQTFPNLEILVCDNFSQDNTEEVVRSFRDDRIKYVNPGRRLSMSDNWEYALERVTSDWVTILGDDDGFLPGAVEQLIVMAENHGVDAVRCQLCNYQWPGVSGMDFGILSVPRGSGLEIRESREWLRAVLSGSGEFNSLPVIYTGGFVKTRILKDIKSRLGYVFGSSIPDVFSGIAIASCIDNYLFICKPLAIGGSSRHSNGRSQLQICKRPDGVSEHSPAIRFLREGRCISVHQKVPTLDNGSIPPIGIVYCLESYLQSEKIHKFRDMPSMQDFLARAIAYAPYGLDLTEWSEVFSDCNGVSLKKAKLDALRLRIIKNMKSIPICIYSAINTIRAGSKVDPIADVHEASIRADGLLRNPPSLTKALSATIERAFMRMKSVR